jgi:hypothetical protein
MADPSNQDEALQSRVGVLFQLWDDIRWVFRELPDPARVGRLSPRWVEHPPTRSILPRLITRAAKQPITPGESVLIINGLRAWSDAYVQLVAISALPREQRTYEMYSEATESLGECAVQLRMAVTSVRRNNRRKRGQHRD